MIAHSCSSNYLLHQNMPHPFPSPETGKSLSGNACLTRTHSHTQASPNSSLPRHTRPAQQGCSSARDGKKKGSHVVLVYSVTSPYVRQLELPTVGTKLGSTRVGVVAVSILYINGIFGLAQLAIAHKVSSSVAATSTTAGLPIAPYDIFSDPSVLLFFFFPLASKCLHLSAVATPMSPCPHVPLLGNRLPHINNKPKPATHSPTPS